MVAAGEAAVRPPLRATASPATDHFRRLQVIRIGVGVAWIPAASPQLIVSDVDLLDATLAFLVLASLCHLLGMGGDVLVERVLLGQRGLLRCRWAVGLVGRLGRLPLRRP